MIFVQTMWLFGSSCVIKCECVSNVCKNTLIIVIGGLLRKFISLGDNLILILVEVNVLFIIYCAYYGIYKNRF